MKSNNLWQHPLTALVAVAFWGSATVLTTLAMTTIGPMAAAFWRWLVALPVLWGVVLATGQGGQTLAALRRRPGPFIFLGLTGMTLLYACQNLALRFTTALNTGLLIELSPVFILLLAVVWLRERPSRTTLLGVTIGVAGALLLALAGTGGKQGGGSSGAIAMLGNLLALAAAFSAAVYTVYGKHLLDDASPEVILTLAATLGVLFSLPLALAEGRFWPGAPATWVYLLALGLGAGAFGNLWWFQMLNETQASRSGIYLLATALLAAALAVLVLGEPLTIWLILGAVLILYGVRLVHGQHAVASEPG